MIKKKQKIFKAVSEVEEKIATTKNISKIIKPFHWKIIFENNKS